MKAQFNFKEMAPILFAVFVDILGFGVALPILTALFSSGDFLPVGTSEHERYALLAVGLTLYPFCMLFGSSFMGDLSDIIGRKKVLVMCMGGFAIGFAFMGIGVKLISIPLLFFGRALTGLTAASLPTTMAAVADMSTDKNKAVHMSFVVFVQSIGFVMGPLIAGVLSNRNLAQVFDDAMPFFASAGLALLAFFWIGTGFQESFVKNPNKKLAPLRLIMVFVEAAKHKRIRLLTSAFIMHQMGIALFVQIILIYLQRTFDYTAFQMGLFNAFFGLWLGLGLVIIIPYAAKRFKIEYVAGVCIALMGVFQLITSASSLQWLVWLLLIPYASFANGAWSAILTSFSHAVDKQSQGWALGITGAVVALSFLITGFAPNLVPYVGAMPLIAFGGVLLIGGAFIMRHYCRRFIA